MVDKLKVYISAALDLRPERDVLARAIAEVPTSLGWVIAQTPTTQSDPDPSAVQQADAYLLLLGSDIQAPVGFEWTLARRADRETFAFYKASARQTQAAQAFLREVSRAVRWQTFNDVTELRRKALALLIDYLLARRASYGLSDAEVQRLNTWRNQALSKTAQAEYRAQTYADAVILTAERFTPSQGHLISGGASA
ncbi:MAG: hypothetical protein RMM31_09320 [Anaerolineae bacterium]|nr:hypothetical protein [Anaerolineae bacterium]